MRKEEAYEIFGLQQGADLSSLQQMFRKLAMEHHPDRGGDAAKMARIIEARELLECVTTKAIDWKQQLEDWRVANLREEAQRVAIGISLGHLMAACADDYAQHLQKFFPDLIALDASVNKNRAVLRWVNADRSTSFKLVLTGNFEKSSYAIGNAEASFTCSVDTSIYHCKRAYKITKRNWQGSRMSGDLVNPESCFPVEAMKKIMKKSRAASKFQRRDAEAILIHEAEGWSTGGSVNPYWYLPLTADHSIVLQMYRTVMTLRGESGASWHMLAILRKNEAGYHSETVKRIPYGTIEENEEMVSRIVEFTRYLSEHGIEQSTDRYHEMFPPLAAEPS